MYAEISPSGFFGPSRCLIPTPGLTSEYPIFAVCVCVCIYTHTPTYTPTHVKNREDTDFCQKYPPMPSNNCSHCEVKIALIIAQKEKM